MCGGDCEPLPESNSACPADGKRLGCRDDKAERALGLTLAQKPAGEPQGKAEKHQGRNDPKPEFAAGDERS